jgi:hypothetical protein
MTSRVERPVVTTSPSCISPGGTYFLAGTQFNGRSEGANYGDESMGNTNFPLVRIVHTATGQVRYGKTFGHSTRSIAPNAATSTTVAANPGARRIVRLAYRTS